jgi:hypothetical protein
MAKTPDTSKTGEGKTLAGAQQERKERLAEALRRNLVKRKDKKPSNPEGKSSAS